MATSFTNSFDFPKIVTGAEAGTWGDDITNNLIIPLDSILGGVFPVTINSADVPLTISQWQNAVFKLTGVLTGNHNLILPLSPNSVGSATAVGGKFVVDNQTTGAFNVTVITAATSSTGVVVPQGSRSSLYSDTVNVLFADDSRTAKLASFAGNPNGSVAGTAASVNSPADVIWDRTNGAAYICTTSGVAAAAVWTGITGAVPPPQGYLTPVSGTPIITGDVVGASRLYWTPSDAGDLLPIWTGAAFGLFHAAELTLDLTVGAQVSNGLYDVFGFIDTAGTKLPQVAFGPSWGSGTGGNQTAGSCARGTGVGGTAHQRVRGLLTNAAALTTANNGASTFNIPANQATYLGTIFVDGTAGQTSCYRTWGLNRKFGIWNAFNRATINLLEGTSAPQWGGSTIYPTFAVANSDANNVIVALTGLAEEPISCSLQLGADTLGINRSGAIGIGLNSQAAATGAVGTVNGNNSRMTETLTASLVTGPLLGINNIYPLDAVVLTGCSFGGVPAVGQPGMQLQASYRG